MKIFTIVDGAVYAGAAVCTFELKRAGVKIPAITVGERGRGRDLDVLPVQLLPQHFEKWQKDGEAVILHAIEGRSKSDRPKLIETEPDDTPQECICVFLTSIGFRGSCDHTGDRAQLVTGSDGRQYWQYHKFPGRLIGLGTIAQGDAGRAGHGHQIVAVVQPNVWFRVERSGRLYGAPPEHYYLWDGRQMTGGLTWEERCLAADAAALQNEDAS